MPICFIPFLRFYSIFFQKILTDCNIFTILLNAVKCEDKTHLILATLVSK